MKHARALSLTIITATMASAAFAQGEADAAAQANNPLADTTSLNLQNQYFGNLSSIDRDANAVLLRGAKPFRLGAANIMARATLPINTVPRAGGGDRSGLGDLNVFAAFLFDTGNPAISFGIGPQLTAPTATDDALGLGKWSAGFANVLFNASSPTVQYG